MAWFFFILGIFQALFLRFLTRVGFSLVKKAQKGHERAQFPPPAGWPQCALIIPVSGSNPNMPAALQSLLEQNYPDYDIYLVVAEESDAAYPLVHALARAVPHCRLVLAGKAHGCCQKNFNLLAGVKAAPENARVYAFCDSTHIAQPDFLRCLIDPIARGEAAFATGYHQAQPKDPGVVTIAYTLTVLFMRFLQGLKGVTQLWGGAMAMSRNAFVHYQVANLWSHAIVDDCSLSASLAKEGVHARLCPAALLTTPVAGHVFGTWKAWLERQILYLKFCMPSQWLALGFVCLYMVLPPIWAIFALIGGFTGASGGTAPFLALCWLCFLIWILMGWRSFIALSIPVANWIWSFFCSVFMFAYAYLATLWTRTLIWGKVKYRVGKNGTVTRIESVR